MVLFIDNGQLLTNEQDNDESGDNDNDGDKVAIMTRVTM
jgi:hypothetical protein